MMVRYAPALAVCFCSLALSLGEIEAQTETFYSNNFETLTVPNLPDGWFPVQFPSLGAGSVASAGSTDDGAGGSVGVALSAIFTAGPPWDGGNYWQYGTQIQTAEYRVTNTEPDLSKLFLSVDLKVSQPGEIQLFLRSLDTNGVQTGEIGKLVNISNAFTTVGGAVISDRMTD